MKRFLLFMYCIFFQNLLCATYDSIAEEINDEIFEKNYGEIKQDPDKALTFDKIANTIVYSLHGNFSIEFTNSSLNKIDKYMCDKEKIQLEKFQTSGHYFKAVFTFAGVSVPLYGTFFNMVKIPVINKNTDSLITENDISYKFVRNNTISDQIIRNPQQLIGLKLSRNYKPLSPVLASDISKPEIIKRNTKVVIAIKLKNLKVETAGKLAEDAKLNQVASVINLKTNRVIDCIVKSPTEVTPIGF